MSRKTYYALHIESFLVLSCNLNYCRNILKSYTFATQSASPVLPLIHPFTLTLTHTDCSELPCKAPACPSGATWGSETCSRILWHMAWEESEIEPPTLRLTDGPLYPLSYSRPIVMFVTSLLVWALHEQHSDAESSLEGLHVTCHTLSLH